MIKRVSKILLPAVLVAEALAGCSSATGQAAALRPATGHPTTGHPATGAATLAEVTGTTRLDVWSVNSDGPDFGAILTGAVGDYGPGVTVHPDGTVDPGHTSELELNLSQGSFRLSIAALDAAFVKAVGHWPYNGRSCSISGSVTGPVPVVAGSGTGAYRGVTGGFTLTISLAEDYVKGPSCSETTAFKAQLILITGTGSIRT
jgi:hypothetical protein